MWRQLLLRLLAVLPLLITALVAGVPLGDAATPTAAHANYDYDHSAAFAHRAYGSAHRLTSSPATRSAGLQADFASFRFLKRPGVAAKGGLSRFTSLAHASEGIRPYSIQARVTAGRGGVIQAHHLIEKRFADVMGGTRTIGRRSLPRGRSTRRSRTRGEERSRTAPGRVRRRGLRSSRRLGASTRTTRRFSGRWACHERFRRSGAPSKPRLAVAGGLLGPDPDVR
jgi:hypothetical protein